MIPIRIRCRTGPTPSTCSSRSSRRRHNLAVAKIALYNLAGANELNAIIEIDKAAAALFPSTAVVGYWQPLWRGFHIWRWSKCEDLSLRYLIPRFIQYLTLIFVGITVTFIIPRLSPTDPVEAQIAMMMARGNTLDRAIRRLNARRSDRNVRAVWHSGPAVFRILGALAPGRPRPFAR